MNYGICDNKISVFIVWYGTYSLLLGPNVNFPTSHFISAYIYSIFMLHQNIIYSISIIFISISSIAP